MLPPRTSRVAAVLPLPLPLSLSPPRARSPLLITLHGPLPEPPFALFSPPRTAAHHLLPRPHLPFLTPLPHAASSRPSRRYYALAPARQRQITLHFQSPKELQRPIPLLSPVPSYAISVLDPRLPPSTEFTSYVAQPSSRHFPRPCPDHPRPTPPASETPLCRASNGCSTPTHSGRASCPRTTSRLLQPPANFRVFFSSLRLASPRLVSCSQTFPAVERAYRLRVIIVDKRGMTSRGTSKLSIPV